MMLDLAPPRGQTSEQSTVGKRPAKSVREQAPDAFSAGQAAGGRPKAGNRAWRLDMFGYLIHGFALLSLSLWALGHFGQVFWFFSLVSGALGANSLYSAYVGFKRAAKGSAKSKTIEIHQ